MVHPVQRIVDHISLRSDFTSRYFTGYTKNPDGKSQFIRGKTSIGDAVDGAIKIFTIAVSAISKFLLRTSKFF